MTDAVAQSSGRAGGTPALIRRIAVLMAVDEAYTTALLVTVASLLEHLRPGVGLDLFLMGGGLAQQTRTRIEGAWDGRVRLHWTHVDHRKLEPLRRHAHEPPPAACFRLLAGSSLPADLAKVIYLDADLLVRGDLCVLWDDDMQGRIVLAVQDSYIQSLPARWLSGEAPAGGHRPYFNSGVMVIDLQAWRAADVERRCLDAARRFPRRTKWLDQHVLNIGLAGGWGPLRPIWNSQRALHLFPDWRCSPYEEGEFHEARLRPAIIHFCTRTKPWNPYCDHPRQDVLAYRAALRRLLPASGREARPPLLRRAVEFFDAPHRQLLDTTSAALRARRRRHAIPAMLPGILRLAILHPWTLVTVPVAVARERVALWLAA